MGQPLANIELSLLAPAYNNMNLFVVVMNDKLY